MRSVIACVVALVLIASFPFVPQPAQAAPTELFFSEYIEGSSNNKALEIFNGTGAPVNLAAGGYNVHMSFNGGTSTLTTPLSGTVASGDVFVLAHTLAAAAILAQADQTNGSGWFNGNDAVVLRKGTTIIDVIGQIGMPAPSVEWGTGLTSTADNTLRRKSSVETGDPNGADSFDPSVEWNGFATNDFSGLGAHGVGVDAAPSVAATAPFSSETGVAPNANISITFSEAVTVTGSWFSISCGTSGSHTATSSGGPQSYQLNPVADFAVGESCTVTVLGAQVTDQDAIDPPDNMAADHTFSFTVAALVQIADIQGASHISPLNGQRRTTEGIVTVKAPSSFWIQDPSPDANDATSEGLLVFGGAAAALVQLGDAVQVRGTVTEFRPGGATQPNLTTTELTSPSVTVVSSGNALPAPTVIGAGGRTPPTTVIDDDPGNNVETGGTFDPATDGIDFYESLEGMRVRVNNAVAVGPRTNFGEIAILADGGAGAGVRTARGGIVIRATDFNPERIILDDVLMATPVVKVRDTFTGPVVGVMDYSFGNFKLLITAPLTPVDGVLAREVTRPAADHEIVVGTYNVENLSPNSGPAQFERHASLIVNNLRSPDLLAIEEIQDNDGVQNGTSSIVTDASVTWTMLIDAIRAAGGPTYQYRQIDPVDDQDGGVPGGNIRVGFLFRTDRGLEFIDRPGGTPTTPTLVVQTPSGPQLSVSPGRIAPDDPAWSTPEGVRKPLAGEFRMRGRKVFVIANHLKSKSGDQPLFGRFQPPTLVTEAQRSAETEVLKDFVEELLDADPNANIVLLGDLNDFEFSRPLTILKEAGLHALIESLPQSERYSYVFDGNSQTLDQVLISGNLFSNFAFTYDVVHVNAEFPDQASDHEPSVVRLDLRDRPVPKQP